jgi:hypothetical protein
MASKRAFQVVFVDDVTRVERDTTEFISGVV